MLRLIPVAILALFLASCGNADTSEAIGRNAHVPLNGLQAEKPTRIISLDYCADQYVLRLADRNHILAVSPDATADFSYMRDAAIGLATVRPVAEDVLILEPDLVVRSYGGGPNAVRFFERAGIPVLQVGWASDIDSAEMNSIPGMIAHIAEGLGEQERGDDVISEFRARLKDLEQDRSDETALYMTPTGVTTGPGSLVHEMLLASGYANFQSQAGWHPLPLEKLAYDHPDLVAAAFFDTETDHPNAWSSSRHPVARAQMRDRPVVMLKGAWTSCGAWFLIDAIEALVEGPIEAVD